MDLQDMEELSLGPKKARIPYRVINNIVKNTTLSRIQ